MKTKMFAKDSENLIVFDENMKTMSFGVFMLKGISFLSLMFLTAIGFCWGVSREAVQAKLVSIDQWANEPANAELLFYTGLFFLVVCLVTYVLYWVYKMFSK